MEKITKENTLSDRILVTPSSYARNHYLYVQEVGTLKSLQPHISRREKLESYLFFWFWTVKAPLLIRGRFII